MKVMEVIRGIVSFVFLYMLDVGIAAGLLWVVSLIPVFNVVVTVKAMCIGGIIIMVLQILLLAWYCYNVFDGFW